MQSKRLSRGRKILLAVVIVFCVISFNYSGYDLLKVSRIAQEKLYKTISKVGESNSKESAIKRFAIFDAQGHKGNLDFLQGTPAGWTVVVTTSRRHYDECPRCLFVGDSQDWSLQKVNAILSSSKVPPESQPKMAAILIALHHGAEWIYLHDFPTVVPHQTLDKIIKNEVRQGLVYQGSKLVFEPCSHFMDPFAWNKGFKIPPQERYTLTTVQRNSVFFVVKDCMKPDLDAKTWKQFFDTQAPPPYVRSGNFAAADFSNVLVSRENAWTLLMSFIPSTYTEQLKVELNLFVQRALWESNGMQAFLPTSFDDKNVMTFSDRCPSCVFMEAAQKMGENTLKKIISWSCLNSKTSFGCFQEILSNGTTGAQIAAEVKTFVSAWDHLLGLVSINYSPRVKDKPSTLTGIPAFFSPAKIPRILQANDSTPPNTFAYICGTKGSNGTKDNPYKAVIPTVSPITDIVLIIVFNKHQWIEYIPLLEFVHGRFFKHIVYCSQNLDSFIKKYQQPHSGRPVTYLHLDNMGNGFRTYSCISAVQSMGYDVAGYLHVSDDVILFPWHFHNFPRNRPWFQKSIRVQNLNRLNAPSVFRYNSWVPWNWTRTEAIDSQKELRQMANSADTEVSKKVSKFLANLEKMICKDCIFYEASDVFFLPTTLASDFAFFSSVYQKHKTFLEIPIPTILIGLTNETFLFRLRGNYKWYEDRNMYQWDIVPYDHFYHAWKLSGVINDKGRKAFFCDRVLKWTDDAIRSNYKHFTIP